MRFASVMTRDVSDAGVFVECEAGAAIPLYRLVHLQVERGVGLNQPAAVAAARRPRAVRGLARRALPPSTGTPSGYALRFLVDPQASAAQTAPRRRVEAVAV